MKVFMLLLLLAVTAPAQPIARVERVPEGGLQPQVVVDSAGTTHLIYLRGDPKACDVRYVRRGRHDERWTEPVTVNSDAQSALAIGTIRGAQLALGARDTLHVVWNGASSRGGGSGSALYYTRRERDQSGFQPQRDLLGDTVGLDGGGSIATDPAGHVFVVWHGRKPDAGEGEGARLVWVRKSTDDGQTFDAPGAANGDFPGACACCSLAAFAAPGGSLFTLYRAAHATTERDMTILVSRDGGLTFHRSLLDPWKAAMCPMSSAALVVTPRGMRGVWETDGRIRSALLEEKAAPADLASGKSKHPRMAINARSDTLITWVTGSGWNRGGTLGWVILDPKGTIIARSDDAPEIPAWSYPAPYAEASGAFVILQ